MKTKRRLTALGLTILLTAAELTAVPGCGQALAASTAVKEASVSQVTAALNTELAAAQETKIKAETAKTKAEQAVADAQSALTEAEKASASAKADLEAAGKNFVNTHSYTNYSTDAMLSAMKNNSYLKELGIWSSSNAAKMQQHIDSCLSVEALIKAAELVKECNSLRAGEDLYEYAQKGAQKIACELMIYAAMSNAVAQITYGHDMFQSDAVSLAWSENLAWGYSDPFNGWYTEEKEVYASYLKTGTLSGGTGHYLNIVGTGNDSVTGIGWNPKTSSASQDWGMASDCKEPMTPDKFISALKAYAKNYQTSYDKAASKESAAKQTLSTAKKTLTAKEKAVKDAQDQIDKLQASKKLLSEVTAAAVTGVTITSNVKKKTLKITWNKVVGATDYAVTWKKAGSAAQTQTTTANALTLKSIKSGTALSITVKAGVTASGLTAFGKASTSANVLQDKMTISKARAAKKKATISWKAKKKLTGYQISYSLNKKFTDETIVTIKGAKKKTAVIKKLVSKKKYYVRLRAYKTIGGVNYTGTWSAVKSVKIK